MAIQRSAGESINTSEPDTLVTTPIHARNLLMLLSRSNINLRELNRPATSA